MIPVLLFYTFALLTLVSGLMVISVKNPVHAVLFLIFAFFNAAGLFLLIGAEMIAMLLIIVYVGAVAVLFLFVVMMLDINFAALKEGFLRYLPIGLLAALILFGELYYVLHSTMLVFEKPIAGIQSPVEGSITNTEAIGNILYTDYVFAFQLAGLILLVAMIGAIVLTLRQREGVRKQNISDQIDRNPRTTVRMVKAESRSGIK